MNSGDRNVERGFVDWVAVGLRDGKVKEPKPDTAWAWLDAHYEEWCGSDERCERRQEIDSLFLGMSPDEVAEAVKFGWLVDPPMGGTSVGYLRKLSAYIDYCLGGVDLCWDDEEGNEQRADLPRELHDKLCGRCLDRREPAFLTPVEVFRELEIEVTGHPRIPIPPEAEREMRAIYELSTTLNEQDADE